MSGIIFFGWSGMVSFHNILVTILSVLLGFLIFVSVAIFIGSLAFYIRDVEGWGIQIMIIFLNMSTQPGSIYTGGVRIFLMFLFPAGMLTFLPVEMINNASWPSILIPIGIAVSFFLGSIWFFYHGLRRYESGNSFGVRD
jgi:ABC-2 type transport system permease protein